MKVPSKKAAFKEIYRILRPGGHFCISDIVSTKELPEKIKKNAILISACVGNVLTKNEYLWIILEQFKNVEIKKEVEIKLTEKRLKLAGIDEETIKEFM